MGRFSTALVGVLAGFVLAHLANQTPQGRELFGRARATLASFVEGFKQSYRG
jgi:hypothetical protein